jgi:hypothetical protein
VGGEEEEGGEGGGRGGGWVMRVEMEFLYMCWGGVLWRFFYVCTMGGGSDGKKKKDMLA